MHLMGRLYLQDFQPMWRLYKQVCQRLWRLYLHVFQRMWYFIYRSSRGDWRVCFFWNNFLSLDHSIGNTKSVSSIKKCLIYILILYVVFPRCTIMTNIDVTRKHINIYLEPNVLKKIRLWFGFLYQKCIFTIVK